MHKYLRSIGFSKINTKREERALLENICSSPTTSSVVYEEEERCGYIGKSFGNGFGVRVFGEYEEDWSLREEYYFPYVESPVISTNLMCSVERHADRASYGGIIEEPNMGISLIFYLNNGIDYMDKSRQRKRELRITGVSLNGLCTNGKILLPLYKTETEKEKLKTRSKKRYSLMEAARNGDENAMESLAIEDMNIFNVVSDNIMEEDVYSVIDTCFMPYGLESDQYSVLGEIQRVEELTNRLSGETCYRLTMDCNDLILTVMVNAMDLLGEPLVGRRFKGEIWLQGTAVYEP